MAKAEVVNARGAPTLYREQFCDMLIEHMKHGNTFESFGALVRCGVATLYNWQAAHPDFLEARKLGMSYLRKFYEDMGRTIATGQLRRVVSEKPMLGVDGKPLYDNDGRVLMDRTYAPAMPNAAVFIFMTKNMLGWRNEVNLTFQELPPGQAPEAITPIEAMETDQLKARMKQLLLKAATDDPEMLEAIKRGVERG